jgi:hypothetical protein
MDITGEPDGPPVKVGVAMTDIATALYAHGAILAALYARERTGVGQRIDILGGATDRLWRQHIPRPDPSGWCATLSRWDRETVCRRAASSLPMSFPQWRPTSTSSTSPAAAFARSLSGPRRQERGVGDDESQAAA